MSTAQGCLWSLLIFFGLGIAFLLLIAVFFFSTVVHLDTLGAPGLSLMQDLLPQLITWLIWPVIFMIPMTIRFLSEHRHIKGTYWPRWTPLRLIGSLGVLLLFLYALVCFMVSPPGTRLAVSTAQASDLYSLRAMSALLMAISAGLGLLLIEMFIWWKHDGEGDLWETDSVTVYTPQDGPLSYALPRFHKQEPFTALLEDLQSSGLMWFWESSRQALVQLTPETEPEFLASWAEWYSTSISIVGSDPEAVSLMLDQDHRRLALEAFARGEDSPVCVVVFQEWEEQKTLVSAAREPSEPVRRLLARWGVNERSIYHKWRIREIPEWVMGLPAKDRLWT